MQCHQVKQGGLVSSWYRAAACLRPPCPRALVLVRILVLPLPPHTSKKRIMQTGPCIAQKVACMHYLDARGYRSLRWVPDVPTGPRLHITYAPRPSSRHIRSHRLRTAPDTSSTVPWMTPAASKLPATAMHSRGARMHYCRNCPADSAARVGIVGWHLFQTIMAINESSRSAALHAQRYKRAPPPSFFTYRASLTLRHLLEQRNLQGHGIRETPIR